MTRPTLNELAAFAAVAKQRSFRKAAEQLGVSRSALSHTLTGLERSLGIRLLHRTTRSVAPTDAGVQLLARLEPVLRDLDVALDVLTDARGAPSGRLRINTHKAGAQWLLAHGMAEFLTRYPDVELDLVTDDRLVDIVAQGFDAGIRLLEAVPQDMVAVRLGPKVRFLAVASPAYLSGRPLPAVPDDLHQHRCIRQRLPGGKRYQWEFSRLGQVMAIDVPGALTLNESELMVTAALQGMGIAYVPEFFAQSALESGALMTVLEPWCPPVSELALYYPGHRHLPAALRALIDLLKAA
jgi:DNA-binding transcriptional LysR family regulator